MRAYASPAFYHPEPTEGDPMRIARIAEASAFDPGKLCKVNLFESPRFFLDVYGLEPGQAQLPHAHAANDKVYLVWEGTARVRVGDEDARLSSGEAVLAPAGVEHALYNDGPGRLLVLAWMAPHPRGAAVPTQ